MHRIPFNPPLTDREFFSATFQQAPIEVGCEVGYIAINHKSLSSALGTLCGGFTKYAHAKGNLHLLLLMILYASGFPLQDG